MFMLARRVVEVTVVVLQSLTDFVDRSAELELIASLKRGVHPEFGFHVVSISLPVTRSKVCTMMSWI